MVLYIPQIWLNKEVYNLLKELPLADLDINQRVLVLIGKSNLRLPEPKPKSEISEYRLKKLQD